MKVEKTPWIINSRCTRVYLLWREENRIAVTLSVVPTLSVGTKSRGAARKPHSAQSSTSFAPTETSGLTTLRLKL